MVISFFQALDLTLLFFLLQAPMTSDTFDRDLGHTADDVKVKMAMLLRNEQQRSGQKSARRHKQRSSFHEVRYT